MHDVMLASDWSPIPLLTFLLRYNTLIDIPGTSQ